MEREIIEREIQVERENIIAFPKDNYYTKDETNALLNEKQDELISGTNIKTLNNESLLGTGNITISAEETDPIFSNSPSSNITNNDITNWNNKSDFSGDYNDLINKPTIPTSLSSLTDDATHRLVTDTEKATWNGKQDALVSGTNIKTINDTSLLGSGNIDIGSSGGEEQVIYVKYNDNFATILEKLTTFYNNYTNDIATILIWTPNIPENKNCLLRAMSDYGSFIECKGQIDGSITNISNYGVTYKKATEVVLKIYIQDNEVTNYTLTTNDYGYIPSSVDEILGMYNTIQYTPTNDYNPATKKYVDDNSIKTIAEDTKIYELNNGIYLSTGTTYKLYYSSNTSYYIKCPGILIVTEYSYVKKFIFIAKGGYVKTQSVQLDTANPYIIVGDSRASSSTSAPYVYDLTNMSMNNVAQTITALKTFSTLPESSVAPTTNNQLVNKAYVDGLVGNINTVLATLTTVGGGN